MDSSLDDNIDSGTMNVIVVPHSHVDPGWLRTTSEYYSDKVKHILNNMVNKLTEHPDMTFIWAETIFFALWWNELDDAVKVIDVLDVCGNFVKVFFAMMLIAVIVRSASGRCYSEFLSDDVGCIDFVFGIFGYFEALCNSGTCIKCSLTNTISFKSCVAIFITPILYAVCVVVLFVALFLLHLQCVFFLTSQTFDVFCLSWLDDGSRTTLANPNPCLQGT